MWEDVERKIRALGADVDPYCFNSRHIRNLGALIFGHPVWSTIRHNPMNTWVQVKEVV